MPIINAIICLAMAVLISAQTTPDNEMLMSGYKGLLIVLIILVSLGLWNLISIIWR